MPFFASLTSFPPTSIFLKCLSSRKEGRLREIQLDSTIDLVCIFLGNWIFFSTLYPCVVDWSKPGRMCVNINKLKGHLMSEMMSHYMVKEHPRSPTALTLPFAVDIKSATGFAEKKSFYRVGELKKWQRAWWNAFPFSPVGLVQPPLHKNLSICTVSKRTLHSSHLFIASSARIKQGERLEIVLPNIWNWMKVSIISPNCIDLISK